MDPPRAGSGEQGAWGEKGSGHDLEYESVSNHNNSKDCGSDKAHGACRGGERDVWGHG